MAFQESSIQEMSFTAHCQLFFRVHVTFLLINSDETLRHEKGRIISKDFR